MTNPQIKLKIRKNPKQVKVATTKGEKKIVVVVFNYRDTVATVPVTLSIAENSQVFCVICCNLLGNSNVSLVTNQDHNNMGGVSHLLCKTVSHDGSKFSFSGTITISKKGQKSHAYQRNENLLLGTEGAVTSEPKLQILANDVFCTHGSTTGYLDEEQVFYLQSRGLSKEKIKALLSKGFLLSGVDMLVNAGLPLPVIQDLSDEVEKALLV
ncbi:MAG: SufD family Fe-S cluster assembly protein [Patescibacteria group bacterium]|jgi:Fe-S cluster assembly scaffold protein SufB